MKRWGIVLAALLLTVGCALADDSGICVDALDGALRLPDAPFEKAAPAERSERAPLEGRSRTERRVACRDRARLMRAVSGAMMEAGAALDDGVVLRSGHCALRVSPAPDADELCIETAADDEDFSGRLADALGDMVQRLESDEGSEAREGEK